MISAAVLKKLAKLKQKKYREAERLFLAEGQTLFDQHLTSENRRELARWIAPNYHIEEIGPWWVYVKNSPDTENRPQASPDNR